MASDMWLRTTQIAREETRCCHIGYFFWLAARVLLYAPSHRKDNTYHSLWYTSHGALAGTRISSIGQTDEGLIQRPIAPRANAHTTELHLAPLFNETRQYNMQIFYDDCVHHLFISLLLFYPPPLFFFFPHPLSCLIPVLSLYLHCIHSLIMSSSSLIMFLISIKLPLQLRWVIYLFVFVALIFLVLYLKNTILSKMCILYCLVLLNSILVLTLFVSICLRQESYII